jgi:hypothetical protein
MPQLNFAFLSVFTSLLSKLNVRLWQKRLNGKNTTAWPNWNALVEMYENKEKAFRKDKQVYGVRHGKFIA